MRRWFLAAGALWLLPLGAHAECTYLRTAYKNLSCKAQKKDKESAADVAASSAVLPGLEEEPIGPLDKLTCNCIYILQGSNPLCETDREQEFSQIYPQDPSAPVCPRAKSLCASVCPRQLP